jgi:hypothetical protein
MSALLAFGLGTRFVVGGLLLFGGAAKLSAGDAFRVSWLRAFVALPTAVLGPVAIAFSLIEVAVGSAFILAIGSSASALATACLLTFVNIVGAATLLRGKQPSCGCAGNFSKSPMSWRLVARNTVFMIAAGLLAITGAVGVGLASVRGPISAGAWLATALFAVAGVHWLATRRSASPTAVHQLRLQATESVEG